MNRLAALVLAATTLPAMAGSVLASDLPVFDETLGFSVRGPVGDKTVWVENGDFVFVCGHAAAAAYVALEGCVPVIGPERAASYELEKSVKTSSGALLTALASRSEASFFPEIEQGFREEGCRVNFYKERDSFSMAVARIIARNAGFEGEMSLDLAEQVVSETGDALSTMAEAGLLKINDETRTVTLIGCP